MTTQHVGRVDGVLVDIPAGRADVCGEMAAEPTSPVDRGLLRVLGVRVVRKDPDGSVSVDDPHDVAPGAVAEWRAVEADPATLRDEQDVAEIAAPLEPGAIAAVLVYENRCAGRFEPRPCGPPVAEPRRDLVCARRDD